VTKSIPDWSSHFKIPKSSLRKKLITLGMSMDEVIKIYIYSKVKASPRHENKKDDSSIGPI
jgi:hypothetical protein